MHADIEVLKNRYFDSHPDDPVILHRKEIINRAYPFHRLRDPTVETAFNEDLLHLLHAWEYCVITVCLDKKKHQETYTTWRYDPYHYCLAILLERFNFWLSRQRSRGDVMAESRGGKEDVRLKRSFAGLWERGTEYVDPRQSNSPASSGGSQNSARVGPSRRQWSWKRKLRISYGQTCRPMR